MGAGRQRQLAKAESSSPELDMGTSVESRIYIYWPAGHTPSAGGDHNANGTPSVLIYIYYFIAAYSPVSLGASARDLDDGVCHSRVSRGPLSHAGFSTLCTALWYTHTFDALRRRRGKFWVSYLLGALGIVELGPSA